MIGTVSIEVNAKNPNMPLWPLRAYVNSPSSLRLVNVPRKIGSWCISAVRLVVVYPDGGVQAAQCVQTGGVWVGTVEGTATSGTCENGYTVFADGTDENGNPVTGYVLGKGDVEILHADGTPSPDPARYSVKLLSASAEQPIEGDMWPTEDGYVIWQGGQAHLLGTPFDQISAYVESAVSVKADLSAVPTNVSQLSNDSGFITSADVPTKTSQLSNDSGFVEQNGTAVIHDLTCDSLVANQAHIVGYAKASDLSAKADVSALDSKLDVSAYNGASIEDMGGSSISADRSFVTVTQLSGVWQLSYGVTTNTLHGQSKTNMSYYPDEPTLGDNAFQLTWGIHSTEYWTLEVYTYNGDWSQAGQYDSEAATSAATALVFPNSSVWECVYEEPQLVETGKLASEGFVASRVADYLPLSGGYLTGPVYAEGTVETPQLNVRNDARDESIMIRHDQLSSLQMFDSFDISFEHPATLPFRRDGTVAYVSDVEQAVSSKADLSALHQDYIEDSAGNRINANLSCTYIDNTAWEVTDPSSNKYVLDYFGRIEGFHTWEYTEPENIKLVLTYANDWALYVYTWQETGPGGDYDWVLVITGSYNGDSDITTIPYFVNATTTYNYSAQRPVTKHLTLATKEYVDSRLSALEARIAALEGN